MKIQDQICTPEQAKELVELGVKYEDPIYYFVTMTSPDVDEEIVLCRPASRFENDKVNWVVMGEASPELQAAMDHETAHASGSIYPAFTVAELGVMLPEYCPSHFSDGLWSACSISGIGKIFGQGSRTEANERASLLINLIKKGMVEVDKINARL